MSFNSSSRSANSSSSKKKRGSSANPTNSSSTSRNRRGIASPRNVPVISSSAAAAAPWGTNSPSSSSASKSSARKSPFTDFGSYMVEKNRKLRDQFDTDASSSGDGKGLFCGVSIFVDGFTVPSSQELRGLMLKHGGRFENYFSRQRVTHIICSHLPDSKMRNLRSFSRGLPVVKPKWIVDSIEANKILSWVPYQLDEILNESCKQRKLSAFFSLKTISSTNGAEILAESCGNSETAVVLKNDDCAGTTSDAEFSNSESKGSEEFLYAQHGSLSEVRMAESTIMEDENSVTQGFHSSPHGHSEGDTICCIDDKSKRVPEGIKSLHGSNQRHSTLGDPYFVENYFKNSRLHFIGTWRNRYRKHFLQKLNGGRSKDHNVKPFIASESSAIIHIDMDCFFVSVVVRSYPALLDKPVAVCHSDNPKGTAEISSANYPARDYGIKAGMFVRDAKALCPNLAILPYNFKAYEEVADQFYSILHKYCSKVQAVSCDEAFLDVTDTNEDAIMVASTIRQEIAHTTKCTASAGIAGTLLLARLATRSAKPNGQCFIPSEKVEEYLKDLPIKALPGIGHSLEEKLKTRHIQTCGQLRLIPKEALQEDFGLKIGDMLWSYSRGVDNRMVELVQETKSVGAEVNWGVRFNDMNDCHRFLISLCKEVSLRLQGCGVQGHTITLKVKKRKLGAKEPIKYMGCGECINMSRSMTVPSATDSVDLLQRISKQLFRSLHVDVKEVRGMGLQISRLAQNDISNQGHVENTLESWLASGSENTRNAHEKSNWSLQEGDDGDRSLIHGEQDSNYGNQHLGGTSVKCYNSVIVPSGSSHFDPLRTEPCKNRTWKIPEICHLDVDVIRSLPPEIFAEMNELYGGKLTDFLKNDVRKDMVNEQVANTVWMENQPLSLSDAKEIVFESFIDSDGRRTGTEYLAAKNKGKEVISCPVVPVTTNAGERKANEDRSHLMPGSLSQVDISILQQLPQELKADILVKLPAHRKSHSDSGPLAGQAKGNVHDVEIKDSGNFKVDLWEGDPPRWVHEFHASSCLMLNIFAESYLKYGRNKSLSSFLLSLVSSILIFKDPSEEGQDEVFSALCELLIQYIKPKIASDIEEIYVCFRLLKRFALRSNFFSHVHDNVLPLVQAFVSEVYGGKLHLTGING